VHPGHEISMHYFSCSGGMGIDLRKTGGTRYAELVPLHPVGFTGHVVHPGASGA
jgi:hypothetical protein